MRHVEIDGEGPGADVLAFAASALWLGRFDAGLLSQSTYHVFAGMAPCLRRDDAYYSIGYRCNERAGVRVRVSVFGEV